MTKIWILPLKFSIKMAQEILPLRKLKIFFIQRFEIEKNNKDIVKSLLTAGANYAIVDNNGKSPYEIAKANNYRAIMDLFPGRAGRKAR